MQTKKLSDIERLIIEMNSKFYDVTEKLEEHNIKFENIDTKLDKVLTQLDSIAGQFKKFDEERELMSDKIRDHTDQIEELQKVVFMN